MVLHESWCVFCNSFSKLAVKRSIYHHIHIETNKHINKNRLPIHSHLVVVLCVSRQITINCCDLLNILYKQKQNRTEWNGMKRSKSNSPQLLKASSSCGWVVVVRSITLILGFILFILVCAAFFFLYSRTLFILTAW